MKRKRTILLVEDEAIIAMGQAQLIEGFGYNAIIAESGEKAVRLLLENHSIDLILMDINLGRDMDGPEAARQILKIQDIPIVFLTSYSDKEYIDKVKKITRYGYVIKNTGDFILQSAIDMAFELFESNQSLKNEIQDRLKIEKKLEEQHKQYLLMFDGMDEVIYVSDPETYEILFMNKKAKEIWGDRIGKKCYQIFQGSDSPCSFCSNDEIFGEKLGRTYIWELQNRSNKKWYHVIDRAILWSDGRMVRYEIAIDINERKLAEDAIRMREENLRVTLESIGDAVIATDSEGKINRMNPIAENLTGWKIKEALGKSLDDIFNIVNAKTKEKADNIIDKVFENGEITGLANHTVLISRDGTEYQIADSAAPIKNKKGEIEGVVLVFRDVTKEYRMQEEILKNKDMLEMFFSQSLTGFFFMMLDEAIAWNDSTDKKKVLDFVFENMKVTKINKAMLGHYGAEEKDLLGFTMKDFFDHDISSGKAMLMDTLNKGSMHIETNERRLDRTQVYIEGHYICMYDKDDRITGIFGIQQDVSERKKIEADIISERDRSQQYLDIAGVIFVVINPDGIITLINKKSCEILGYKEEEILGKNWFDLIIPERIKDEIIPVAKKILAGELNSMEYYENPVLTKSGEERIIAWHNTVIKDDNGVVIGTLSSGQDITERRIMEESLKDSFKQLTIITENVPNIIWKSDIDENGKFVNTYISEVANEFLALPPNTIGNDWDKYFSYIKPEYIPKIMEKFKYGIENPEEKITFEYKVEKADGEIVWFSSTGQVYKENGNIRVYGSTININERKNAEEKIHSLLIEKELLLKEVHHRIRNNMNVIKALLSKQASSINNADVEVVFKEAISRIDSMSVLYDKLYETQNYVDISIKGYLSRLIDEIYNIFPDKNHINIEKQIDDFNIGTKIIFPLGIMLNELFTNAMKYAFNDRDSGLIKISVIKKDRHVTIVFEDNGIGLPKLDTKNYAGFGLTLIEMLTKQIDGSYKIESKKGTKFIIEFKLP